MTEKTGNTQNRKRIALQPIHQAIEKGMLELALTLCGQILQQAPKAAEVIFLKGDCHEKMGELDAAVAAFREVSQLVPGNVKPLFRLARIAARKNRPAEEIEYARRIFDADKTNQRIYRRIVELYLKMDNYVGALEFLEHHDGDPYPRDLQAQRIKCLAELGRNQDAMALVYRLLEQNDFPDDTILQGISVADEAGELENFIGAMEKAVAAHPERSVLYTGIGKCLFKLGRGADAKAAFEKALELKPDDASTWHEMAIIQRQNGDVEGSQQSMLKCLEFDPYHTSALRVFGYDHKYTYGDDMFKRLSMVSARMEEYEPVGQVQLHYALGKAYEDVEDLPSAFAHYIKAGQIQQRMTPYSDKRMRSVLSTMRQYLKAEDYQAAATEGCPTDKPVFVFGMPRSGTSLLEQVIASHPQAYGAGELKLGSAVINSIKVGRITLETRHEGMQQIPMDSKGLSIRQRGDRYLEYVESLAGKEYKRIVDKMPGNFNWVGLLATILPNAYFIHSRRHPVEICLSEFRIYFPDGINFSYNLRDLGIAYRLYNEFMLYWQEVLPEGRMLHVRYEDMVADLESETKRILNYIDLPWDDQCLRFYETQREVKTASVTQVRKPIYTTSVNRWRKYEPYLKPLLDELGPLVKEYEDELGNRLSNDGRNDNAN